MAARCTLEQALELIRPGMRVFVPGMSGECLALYEALKAQADSARDVTFVGALFPGINRSDFLGLSPSTRQRAYFMQASLRAGLDSGRVEMMPLDYPGIWNDLAEGPPVDIAFLQVAPADDRGQFSLGVSCDFQAAALRRAKTVVALVNARMPQTRSTVALMENEIDHLVECDFELLQYDGGTPTEAMHAHGAKVASLVRDGSTLEFGVGKLQGGILAALKDHQGLKVWSGMASGPILGLLDQGVIKGRDSVNIGVALGDSQLYQRCGEDDAFCFRPVSETHDVREISLIPDFCAVNSAVEVDLLGQVNADTLNGRLLAGVGGLPAFVAGAQLSAGGQSIIALPAATDNGKYSRIVPRLGAPGACALPRHLADHVVTEHGVASLRGLDVLSRAKALIKIADPRFQETLEQEWSTIRSRL